MSATSIENSLIRYSHEGRLVLQFHPRPEYLGTLSMGMLVLEADGIIHAVNRKGEMFLAGCPSPLDASFDRIFEQKFVDLQRRLVEGETLRIRDRMGSAVSIRCVANRASFAMARRISPAKPAESPEADRNLFRDMVFDDPALWRRLAALVKAAKRGASIRITGETGTGKEIVARLCHAAAGRRGPFVVLDAEMADKADFARLCFGSAEGSGLLQQAAGGTLFLDEVTKISPAAQAALARVLDTGEFRHPHTGMPVKTDLRIVSAVTLPSNNAEAPVSVDGLLPALRYRLDGFRIHLPALRERSDLPALALRFAGSVRGHSTIAPAAMARLRLHDWPGNLHELRAVVTQAVSHSRQGAISVGDLDGLLPDPLDQAAQAEAGSCPVCASVPWKAQHCQAIRTAVAQHGGNVSKAARDLGMSRTTVYKHLAG